MQEVCSSPLYLYLIIYNRVRAASSEVIEALISSGADLNHKNNISASPLTLVLLRAASNSNSQTAGVNNNDNLVSSHQLSSRGLDNSFDLDKQFYGSHLENDEMISLVTNNDEHNNHDRSRSSSKKFWIKAAKILIKNGIEDK